MYVFVCMHVSIYGTGDECVCVCLCVWECGPVRAEETKPGPFGLSSVIALGYLSRMSALYLLLYNNYY